MSVVSCLIESAQAPNGPIVGGVAIKQEMALSHLDCKMIPLDLEFRRVPCCRVYRCSLRLLHRTSFRPSLIAPNFLGPLPKRSPLPLEFLSDSDSTVRMTAEGGDDGAAAAAARIIMDLPRLVSWLACLGGGYLYKTFARFLLFLPLYCQNL